MTKDELLVELSKEQQIGERYRLDNKKLRQEFAKALKGYRKEFKMYGEDEIVLDEMTWEEIFVQIGKLLVKKSQLDLAERIQITTENMSELSGRVEKLYQDNERP